MDPFPGISHLSGGPVLALTILFGTPHLSFRIGQFHELVTGVAVWKTLAGVAVVLFGVSFPVSQQ